MAEMGNGENEQDPGHGAGGNVTPMTTESPAVLPEYRGASRLSGDPAAQRLGRGNPVDDDVRGSGPVARRKPRTRRVRSGGSRRRLAGSLLHPGRREQVLFAAPGPRAGRDLGTLRPNRAGEPISRRR